MCICIIYNIIIVVGQERWTRLLSQLIVGSGERPAQDHHAQYRNGTVGQAGRTSLHGSRAFACEKKKTQTVVEYHIQFVKYILYYPIELLLNEKKILKKNSELKIVLQSDKI